MPNEETKTACKHSRTFSLCVPGLSDMLRCVDCGATMSGRELAGVRGETKTAPELPSRPEGFFLYDHDGAHWIYDSEEVDVYTSALERQLSDAQRENQELRAQLAERNSRGSGFLYVPKAQYDAAAAQLAAKDERIAELEEARSLSVAGVVRDESVPCGWRNQRAERLEATLKSIREQPVERPEHCGAFRLFYIAADVDPILEHYAQQVAALQLNQKGRSDD